ncbi:hypothetical protein GGP72_000122 [Salinibacter ruber]|uniref:Terminase large subunit gp17-like C-terminal domain-containing protein n=1 Tax=Salinibacter ruber TaxID=146919 RepID=A0A9X2PYF9_9BACT|nr:hypothetical protein [Salinibacter ruber]MCS3679513.1 hypothetical protein [Salinibacter ruber]
MLLCPLAVFDLGLSGPDSTVRIERIVTDLKGLIMRGKRQDYTALVVLVEREEQKPVTRTFEDRAQTRSVQRWTFSEHWLQHLHRWPLGTKYRAIAADVAELTRRPVFRGTDTTLVVDRGGVGESVYEQIASRVEGGAVDLVGVTITGGKKVRPGGPNHYRVPKRDLVAALQVAVQNGEIKAASELELWDTLRDELESFTAEITETGHDSYEARQGEHDDLVLALSLPVWLSGWWRRRGNSTTLPPTVTFY